VLPYPNDTSKLEKLDREQLTVEEVKVRERKRDRERVFLYWVSASSTHFLLLNSHVATSV